MTDARTFEDTFNLLCGARLGGGAHRTVFECRIRPDLVVKVEIDTTWRGFYNAREYKFYTDYAHCPGVEKWLAPVEFISPDGRILLQKRCDPVRSTDTLPDKIPAFFTDIKRENFGWLNGKFVCLDYALTIDRAEQRLKKVTVW